MLILTASGYVPLTTVTHDHGRTAFFDRYRAELASFLANPDTRLVSAKPPTPQYRYTLGRFPLSRFF